MKKLVLIKHSLPEIDPSIDARDWRLSEEGRQRCVWLAGQLASAGLTSIVSSQEPKAAETAELLGEHLGLPVAVRQGLHENDRTGFPFIEARSAWEQRFVEFFASPSERLIGNESADDAFSRFDAAVRASVQQASGNIAIVAHGTVISLFASRYNPMDVFELWQSLNPLPAFLVVDLAGYRLREPPLAFGQS